MSIRDHISSEADNLKISQKKSELGEARKTKKKNLIISRTFEHATRRYERKIARALVSDKDFSLKLYGFLPIEKPAHLLRLAFNLAAAIAPPWGITAEDIKANPAYQSFERELSSQGVAISALSAYDDYAQASGGGTIASMKFERTG